MTFIAAELDACPSYGWTGGPNIDILIRTLANKHERRNDESDIVLHSYTLPFAAVPDTDYLEYIKSAYLALRGPHKTFLTKDYGDFRHGFASNNQAPMPFGEGDGAETEFQLSKTYTFGPADEASWTRDITKPLAAGLVVRVNGTITAVTLDPLTGIVTFAAAPADNAILTWEGEFRVPVRFADFYLPSTIDTKFSTGEFAISGSCSLIEVPFGAE